MVFAQEDDAVAGAGAADDLGEVLARRGVVDGGALARRHRRWRWDRAAAGMAAVAPRPEKVECQTQVLVHDSEEPSQRLPDQRRL